MRIAYYDESGDDGFPKYSSPFFVLSTLYLHYLDWKNTFQVIRDFRRELREQYRFPVKLELHTRQFLMNKNPYRNLSIREADRVSIIGLFCDLVANLPVRVINVGIIKANIQRADYPVLDNALKYSVQRIENDLRPAVHSNERFLLITDPGRVGKMRKTTRRIQRINFIPSKYGSQGYRREISTLIEDPLPKDSAQSYFIQLVDMIAYIVFLRMSSEHGVAFANRLPSSVNAAKVTEWLGRLKPSLNLEASGRDDYGIVMYPRSK